MWRLQNTPWFQIDVKRSVYFPPSSTDGDTVLLKNTMRIASRYTTPLTNGVIVGKLESSRIDV